MPDIVLEPLHAKPDTTIQGNIEFPGPYIPASDKRGDINYLCGHCQFAIVQQLRSPLNFISTPPGPSVRCPACSKYSLLRMTGEQTDQVARYGAPD